MTTVAGAAAPEPSADPPAGIHANGADGIAAALARIERRLDRMEKAVGRLDAVAGGAPSALAMIADTFDGVAQRASESGVDFDERIRTTLALLERLTRAEAAASFRALLDSGLFAEGALAALSNIARALPAAGNQAPRPLGPWSAWRALKEPEVQRALGFVVDIARRLGASLSPQAARGPRQGA